MLLSHPHALRVFQAAQHELEQLEQSLFSPEEIEAVKLAKLERLWERAITTPYYKHLACSTPEQLYSLPVTPKSIVKKQPELFFAQKNKYLKYYESSGTSGIPTATPRLAEDIIWNTVSVVSCWKRILQQDDKVATLLPSDISPVGDLVSNVCEYLGICLVRCYPFALGISDWNRVEQLFLRYQPTCLFAAPGVLVQLMRVLKQRGCFATAKNSISKIMLLGEVSTFGLRQMLAENWEAKVYDVSYGSTETGTIAAACKDQQLHILNHSFVLEVYDNEQIVPLKPGLQGELVVTTLNNYARPLLRYATGDLVEVSSGSLQTQGLHLPVLKVLGRKDERICIKGVALDIETLERQIYKVPGITGYMIEMNKSGEQAKLLLEKDIDFPSGQEQQTTDALEKAFGEQGLGWDATLLLNQLPTITKSGGGQKNWKKTNVRVAL